MKNYHKILAQAGRRKSVPKGRNKRKWCESKFESHPEKEGMRKPYCKDHFSFKDHIAPLERWLHKQVGRPWAKVWAEVSSIGKNSFQGKHVRDHVKQWMHMDVILGKDGKHYVPGYHGLKALEEYSYHDALWVDAHGILRVVKAKPRKRGEKTKKVIKKKAPKPEVSGRELFLEVVRTEEQRQADFDTKYGKKLVKTNGNSKQRNK